MIRMHPMPIKFTVGVTLPFFALNRDNFVADRDIQRNLVHTMVIEPYSCNNGQNVSLTSYPLALFFGGDPKFFFG